MAAEDYQQITYHGERTLEAGILIEEVRITHLSYAEEIAAAMLQRQQAASFTFCCWLFKVIVLREIFFLTVPFFSLPGAIQEAKGFVYPSSVIPLSAIFPGSIPMICWMKEKKVGTKKPCGAAARKLQTA